MNKWLFENSIRNRISRHTLFFLITVLIFAAILFIQNESNTFLNFLWITFFNALFFFGYAYITLFLLIPQFLLKRQIIWFIILFILIGFGLSAVKLVFSDYIFYSSISPENAGRQGVLGLQYILVNTKDMTFIVALLCVLKYAKDYLYVENTRKKLELQHKRAQEKLLQSQLHPHFLFNTINNLYALSLLSPEKTLDVTEKIKKVLQYIIDESQRDMVELEDEIELVKNYILLEKLRYGERLKIDFIQKGDLQHQKIPPMILFFLVENCFKHGSSPDSGAPWIKIEVLAENGILKLKTENSKPESKKSIENKKSAFGLKNLEKRLEMIYSKSGFSLITKEEKSKYKVDLELTKRNLEYSREKYR